MARKPCHTPGCTRLTSTGAHCPEHQRQRDQRNNQRLHAKQQAHGRDTAQWRRTREARLIADEYRCQDCHTPIGLTVHLDPRLNGDHTQATIDTTITLCRSCHGKRDGGRSHEAIRLADLEGQTRFA